jgi:hypothetical protein
MTATEELAAAAFQLRNPFHHPGLTIGIDPEFGFLIADWLEREARQEAYTLAEFGHRSAAPEALAVARAITREPASDRGEPEHCTHYRPVHDQHHTSPVTGCPWCTQAATSTEE